MPVKKLTADDRFGIVMALIILGVFAAGWEVVYGSSPPWYSVGVVVLILCLTVPLILSDR